MKPLQFLLLAILLPATSFAQSNFKPGYAVTLKGDTVQGFFDYREWDRSPKTVKFKTDINGATQLLTPVNTSYFDINGLEAYQRYAGKITLDHINESSVLNERDTTFKIDTIFIQVLQRGEKMTLYSYSDNIKTRFYFTEKNDEMPQELGYRLYYNSEQVTATKGRTVNENTYMMQLYNLAQKYNVLNDKLQRMIEDSRYEKGYILDIVSKINGIGKKKKK